MAKILIVDDSRFPRMLLRKMLEASGHQIAEAADGASTLERYSEERPDVVLLDLFLAEESGLDVLARLLAVDREARVVLATADDDPATRARAEQAGARGFIAKPFAPGPVLTALDAVLATPCSSG